MTETIRVVGTEYASVITLLQNECFPDDRWSEQSIRLLLSNPGGFGVVADGGFALGRAIVGEAELLSLGVWPEARGRGLGKALLHRVISEAHLRGAEVLLLEVAVNNSIAIDLYHRCGFVAAGHRRDYYSDGQDAILLGLKLQE